MRASCWLILGLLACGPTRRRDPVITEITGTVRDAETSQVIEGVGITTDPPTESTTTDAGGSYRIRVRLAPGKMCRVIATKAGYEQGSVTVVVKEGTSMADISLVPAMMLESIAISGDLALVVGETSQLSATCTFGDGSASACTGTTWSSSDPMVATVSNSGVLIAVAPGTTMVEATEDGVEGSAIVTVDPSPALVAVAVAGPTECEDGASISLSAICTYSDTSQRACSSANWSSSDSGVATVSAGIVTCRVPGASDITASVYGIDSAAHHITVSPTIAMVTVIGPSGAVVGDIVQMSAVCTDSAGATAACVSPAWMSTTPAVATVDGSGAVTALTAGATEIRATQGMVTGSLSLTVSEAASCDAAALGFDGVNDSVNVAYDASLATPNAITAEAWISIDAALPNRGLIIGRYDSFAAGCVFLLDVLGTSLRMCVFTDCLTSGASNYTCVEGGTIPLQTWTHVAGTFSNGGSPRIFIDGTEAFGTTSIGDGPVTNLAVTSTPLVIGGNATGSTNNASLWFDGKITQARLSQAAEYAGAFTPPTVLQSTANTVLLFPLEEGMGTTAADASGLGNDGAISGAIWVAGLSSCNPLPVLSSVSPATVEAGSGAFTLNAIGSGFVAGSQVTFAGSNVPTSFVSSTALSASIPASAVSVAGTNEVRVVNASPGGGTSGAVVFTVTNPVPVLSSISPSTANAGDPAFTITLSGSGFVLSSQVEFDGSNVTTTFVSSTELSAAIPASAITTAGARNVTVVNPAPGGGTSAAQSFTVNPAGCADGTAELSSANWGRSDIAYCETAGLVLVSYANAPAECSSGWHFCTGAEFTGRNDSVVWPLPFGFAARVDDGNNCTVATNTADGINHNVTSDDVRGGGLSGSCSGTLADSTTGTYGRQEADGINCADWSGGHCGVLCCQ